MGADIYDWDREDGRVGSPPFWFAAKVDDPEVPWRAFIQFDGRVDNLATGFLTEADCLDYIRGEILPAATAVPGSYMVYCQGCHARLA